MHRRRSHPSESKEPGHERWLVSYADFITLLLAFFVSLYSVTRLDHEQLAEAQESIQQAIHSFVPRIRPRLISENTRPVWKDESLPLPPPPEAGRFLGKPRAYEQLRQLQQKLEAFLKNRPEAGDIQIHTTAQGTLIRFRDLLFFDSGKATLRPAVYPLLQELAAILRKIPNEIMVEGHTDNRPIHTIQYPSNWELSTARAAALVRYFIEQGHLDPRRLSAAGYGKYRPVADNRQESGRQANRRVDIIIRPLKTL